MAAPVIAGAMLRIGGHVAALVARPPDPRRRRSCVAASCLTCAGCIVVMPLLAVAIAGCLIAAVAGTPACAANGCDPATGGSPISCRNLSVSQGFGDTPWEHPHSGIDLVCPAGTAVRALASGVFNRRNDLGARCPFFAGRHGGYGTYGVVSAGDGTQYLYGHLGAYALPDGAAVEPGAVLGFEGTSGCSSGYHLHFEVRRRGWAVNPCPYLPGGYPFAHRVDGRCWGDAKP